jgi:hypothetical protein
MGRFTYLLIASSAALALTGGSATAQGVVPDRSTIVTISAPVSVPGVVLPAGEYLFRLADSQASRNVVQIFDKDRTKIFATLMAIPALRNEPSGDAIVTFRESPATEAPALRYWYYAGEKAGQEFAYPKDQAIAIARASGEPVMSMSTTGSSEADAMQKAELTRIDPKSPDVSAAADAPDATAAAREPRAAPSEPAAAPATPAEPETPAAPPAPPARAAASQAPAPTAAPAERPTATSERDVMPAPAGTSGTSPAAADAPGELPRTASSLPLAGMLGVLALGAAFGVRALRRRLVV